jgi:splicing factor 45
LGKYEQGILTPLVAKKISDKCGVIINTNIMTERDNRIDIKNFYNRTPTKVIMMTNIIYPGEFTEELYYEIKEECENCGKFAVSILRL